MNKIIEATDEQIEKVDNQMALLRKKKAELKRKKAEEEKERTNRRNQIVFDAMSDYFAALEIDDEMIQDLGSAELKKRIFKQSDSNDDEQPSAGAQ